MPSQPVALITGGTGDLAMALQFAFEEAGWHVLAPGRMDLDVTSAESVERFFAGLTQLDLLVNNAGVCRDGLLISQPAEERDAVLDVCLRGAFLCSRQAAQLMSPQLAGHIVNIGSHAGLTGRAGQTAYAAAKAGLTALTKSLAAELGPAGIRVNCVLPGWLETKMTRGLPGPVRDRALAAHTLGRFSTTGDAARFVLFLHSLVEISGQVFALDSRLLP